MPPDLLRGGSMERERIGDDLRSPQLLKRASTVSTPPQATQIERCTRRLRSTSRTTPTHGALSSLWVRRIDRRQPRTRSSQTGPPISAAVHESLSGTRQSLRRCSNSVRLQSYLRRPDRAASTRAFDPEKTLARPSKVATQQLRRRIDKETGLLCVSAQLV